MTTTGVIDEATRVVLYATTDQAPKLAPGEIAVVVPDDFMKVWPEGVTPGRARLKLLPDNVTLVAATPAERALALTPPPSPKADAIIKKCRSLEGDPVVGELASALIDHFTPALHLED